MGGQPRWIRVLARWEQGTATPEEDGFLVRETDARSDEGLHLLVSPVDTG